MKARSIEMNQEETITKVVKHFVIKKMLFFLILSERISWGFIMLIVVSYNIINNIYLISSPAGWNI